MWDHHNHLHRKKNIRGKEDLRTNTRDPLVSENSTTAFAGLQRTNA